jgi:hypothetical protein
MMGFIEDAAYGMSAAFVPIYVDFMLIRIAGMTTNDATSAFTGAA